MSYRETIYIVDKEVATCVSNGTEEAAPRVDEWDIVSQTDYVINVEQ